MDIKYHTIQCYVIDKTHGKYQFLQDEKTEATTPNVSFECVERDNEFK